jgi:GPH family glycoside/pentoside/hexuronide:cation symporter
VIAASIVGWILISRRTGKKMPAFWGILLLGIGTCIGYPLFPPGQILPVVFAGIIGGILVGSVFLLDATVADIVDYDELKTREHREGVYFGFWRMGSKLARALGLALSGLLLDWTGFDPKAAEQSSETSFGLALIFGPGVGVFFIIAALIYLAMPLTKEKIQIVSRRLRQREQRAHVSPLA